MINNETPFVSVVMPVYNAAKWIDKAIQSILLQTYGNLELIIVNDGSTDDTVEHVKRFTDHRIRLIDEGHEGFLESISKGIHYARGEFIARMDGDDISHPDRIQQQIDVVTQKKDIVLCGTGFGFITPKGYIVKNDNHFSIRELTASLITSGRRCADASMLFRRDMAIEVGIYDDDLSLNELSLWYKLLKRGRAVEIGRCYYFMRIHENNANLGQINIVPRGRDARKRYDPQGYADRYGNAAKPSIERVKTGGIRKRVLICHAAKDYQGLVGCVTQAFRILSIASAVHILILAALRTDVPFRILLCLFGRIPFKDIRKNDSGKALKMSRYSAEIDGTASFFKRIESGMIRKN